MTENLAEYFENSAADDISRSEIRVIAFADGDGSIDVGAIETVIRRRPQRSVFRERGNLTI